MPERSYHCPRCGSEDIVDYGETFDCKHCVLEFEKKDFDLIEDEANILAIEEKREVASDLYEDKNDEGSG
ncbi:MAG: hypothetical protein GF353_02935 [Candidatus Lokiarchaeota archaeon]|nr:hypothetical protein [Candidatus Lokiarchaeota archaeon]